MNGEEHLEDTGIGGRIMLKLKSTNLKSHTMLKLISKKYCIFLSYLTRLSVSSLYSVDDRMINEYRAVSGMRIGRGGRSTWRKPSPLPVCPPQIPFLVIGLNLG
jgi:hypothetical protein